uniref:C-Jun-amino-terminal kinase-interacting protein 4-like n=1 Tax=Saccoglossus kowalevskii TaxID=10224 RepID=A0ABM0LX30_SACKO|nr:PREDICTED: c-Jun-amino-terminal kinase-interacting protein 4-like [Saccoglossus kowalevskii]
MATIVTPTSDNFFGMGKEVENLILENSELRATKHALNIVKDDLIARVDELSGEMDMMKEEIQQLQTVKGRLNLRITELEDEIKKAKEENEKIKMVEEDEDVPMAQRKRFTRVEMARVLMERNQYKERLMELQEAVRWTEMIRASREHPSLETKKNKSTIWKFFSNLFSSSNAPSKKPYPPVNVKFNAPTSQVSPAPKKRTTQAFGSDRSKVFDFLEADGTDSAQRIKEKREQYRKVKAHVKKDDGRVQAYGWSLPAKVPPSSSKPITQTDGGKSMVGVPVPVYCRPLLEQEPGMKIWCAAGVNLGGGKTRDGGSIVGASVFYSNTEEKDSDSTEKGQPEGDLEKLEKEIKDHEKEREEITKQNLSSLVWICTSTHSTSKITVIDANQPQNVLDSFPICNSHVLCIASVKGAKESDYPASEEVLSSTECSDPEAATNESGLGNVTMVTATQTSSDATPRTASPTTSDRGDPFSPIRGDYKADVSAANIGKRVSSVSDAMEALTEAAAAPQSKDTIGMEGIVNEDSVSAEGDGEEEDHEGRSFADPLGATAGSQATSMSGDLHKDGVSSLPTENDFMYVEVEKMSSVQPTMWLGAQNGWYHSKPLNNIASWEFVIYSGGRRFAVAGSIPFFTCLLITRLQVTHVKGRVLVALADGTIAVFHRAEDGQWNLANYHLLDLGRPHHSIRCMVVVYDVVWCGYRNKIHVIQPKTLKIEKSFDAHPRKESQVRQLAWVGDGVWVSIRLDSTLRLYHAHTYQHLQDVDIEPYVSKMLGTGKLGFSFVRITALKVSSNRLWVGTGNGVIISIPLTEASKPTLAGSAGCRPGGVIRVYSDSKSDSVTPGSFIPYCSMAQAQLSFHGHRDAVKFFVAVPGTATAGGMSTASSTDTVTTQTPPDKLSLKNMLLLSGGEGYIDFRIGDGDDEEDASSNYGDMQMTSTKIARSERSHLIVWQVTGVSP